jgi:hypothetical protein
MSVEDGVRSGRESGEDEAREKSGTDDEFHNLYLQDEAIGNIVLTVA